MSGYFKVEKPTQLQVSKFIAFIRNVQKVYPNVKLKQHKDVYPGRTCAELSDAELQKFIQNEPIDETLEQKVVRLENELAVKDKQMDQLIMMVKALIKIITK
jgi:hypothetical protein